ncbi:MAG TPA: 50S ribosomal protein L6 [Firmicutes bacterium]|nr:50S ribosomal protein L6 [Candidatus Fermentithermobacillaceae bacterium]
MSRIGTKPIKIPKGVTVTLEGNTITVKGPKGTLKRALHPDMKVEIEGDELRVKRPTDERLHRALHGLTRTLISNMITGVTEGYEKALEMSGVGYRASKTGDKVVLNLGFAKPCEIVPPSGIQIEVPTPTSLVIRGIDKELVGQVAANIRKLRPPEPYQGTGIKYVGEKIRRKVAKSAK